MDAVRDDVGELLDANQIESDQGTVQKAGSKIRQKWLHGESKAWIGGEEQADIGRKDDEAGEDQW